VSDLFVSLRKAGLLLLVLLSACGGGNDSNNGSGSGSTQISTHAVSFKVDSATAAAPAGQVVSVTFGTNIAHLGLTQRGVAVGDVTSTFSGRTAQITINPAAPSSIGPGAFEGAVAITGYLCADANCSAFAAAETQTIAVKLQVSATTLYVAPHVIASQSSQSVIVRGVGFSRFNITGVHFGAIAATSMLVTADSELLAQIPALAAGTYPVTVDATDHEGAIPSEAVLTVVDPIAYSSQALNYPATATQINSLVYDPERRSILVATDAANSQIVRYTYDAGSWSAQSSGAIPNVRDLALTINGTGLYVLSDSQLTVVNPVSLAAGASYSPSGLASGVFLKSLAVSNLNTAYITTGSATSGAQTQVYVFSERAGAMIPLVDSSLGIATTLNYGSIETNIAGSIVVAVQGDPASSAAPAVYVHSASDPGVSLAATAVTLHQTAAESALDRAGNRLVIGGSLVYDGSLAAAASIPVANATAVKPDGTRVYAYYSATNAIETFDVSTFTNGASFTSLGSTALLANPGTDPKMTITPDGTTIILAGASQIVIQPTPTF
jgi:hypothetical protein